jgi:hypothetical protein
MGIGDDQGEMPFQDRVDRLPVDPGALHADVGHPQLPQPVAQGLEVGGHGAEVSDLLARLLARAADENTSDDAGLVDIQARSTITSMALTLRDDRARPRRRRTGRQTLTPVLAGVRTGRDKRRFLDAVREQSFPRDDLPSLDRPSRDRGAIMRPSWHARKAREHFHSRRCAPRALGIFPENDVWSALSDDLKVPFFRAPRSYTCPKTPEIGKVRSCFLLNREYFVNISNLKVQILD